jgi:gliding motility-associated-like protein
MGLKKIAPRFMSCSIGVFFLSLSPIFLHAQDHVFVSLKGTPLNVSNWNLIADARVADTNGDSDTDADEVVLCSPFLSRNGGLFYREPIDLSICSKWAVSFEFRMFEGTGADGIAFCFLVNPPTGYISGSGVGIPTNPRGLMVVLDTYNNCGGPNPELQIRYGTGFSNYSECPTDNQPTLFGVRELRSNQYTKARVEYNRGNIKVTVAESIVLEGYYPINYAGYMGFTSSTGGLTDLHSVKNVTIFTQIPEVSAIPDTSFCLNDSLVVNKAPGFNLLGWSDGSKADRKVIRDTGLYWVKLENQCGSFIDTFRVKRQDPFQYDLGTDKYYCFGGKVTLDAGSIYQEFRWSNGTLTQTNSVAKVGVYSVRVRKGSCWAEDSIRVSVLPAFKVDLGKDTSFCRGDSIIVQPAKKYATYLWDNGKTQAALMVSAPASFSVTVTDEDGCIGYGSKKVGMNELPQFINFDASVPFRVTLEVTGGTPPYYYSRDNSYFQADKTISIISGNYYSLYIKDKNGCRDQKLNLLLGIPQITIPNFFTPNGDGYHDFWEIKGIEAFPDCVITIYDRSGRLLAQYKGIVRGWDGTFGSLPMPENDYWYVVDLKNGEVPKRGHFTLKRQ